MPTNDNIILRVQLSETLSTISAECCNFHVLLSIKYVNKIIYYPISSNLIHLYNPTLNRIDTFNSNSSQLVSYNNF